MDLKNKIWFSGVWLLPMTILLAIAADMAVGLVSESGLEPAVAIGIVLIPCLLMVIVNSMRYVAGERDFGPVWQRPPTAISNQKRKAMNPPVPKDLLSVPFFSPSASPSPGFSKPTRTRPLCQELKCFQQAA